LATLPPAIPAASNSQPTIYSLDPNEKKTEGSAKADPSFIILAQLFSPQTYSISASEHRCIHYRGGDAKLYGVTADPYGWDNFASALGQAERLNAFRQLVPLRAGHGLMIFELLRLASTWHRLPSD
jgi:hypothetical protein